MPYTVAGTLKLPESGKPAAGVILKFVALSTISPVLAQSDVSVVTSSTGAYSVALEFNDYSVFATLYDNKPVHCGQISLYSSLATGKDLPTLLNGGFPEPLPPDWLLQLQTLADTTTANAASANQSATLAAAQAVSAKADADRAAQIAGLATVDQAVRAAKLPTPDVSIPFTTDGRMTHGKGAPVLVGTTPVAQIVTYERLGSQTMIDKSGRLVTVPAGEMAIEQQGLAIFEQSVNLATPSINWPFSSLGAAPWVHGTPDAYGWIAVSGAGKPDASEGSYKDFTAPTKDTPHTFSMDVLKTPGLNIRLRAYGATLGLDVALTDTAAAGAQAAEAVTDMGSYWRIEVTRTFVSDTTRIFRIYPFGTNVGATGAMTYRRIQLEAKPFATPYIENATSAQTTRPATTRCDFPLPGNMHPLTDWQELTIAFEFDTAGIPPSGKNQYIFVNGGGVGSHLMARIESNSLLRFYRSAGATHQPTIVARRRYKMCYRINRNACDLFIDGVRIGGSIIASPVTSGLNDILRLGYASSPDQCLNGHLRNLNIWNTPLTDAQCVAASS